MKTRTVLMFAVLCIAILTACSGNSPVAPPPPPPGPSVSVIPASANALVGDTMSVSITSANSTTCEPDVTGSVHVLDKNNCTGFRIIFDAVGQVIISATATGSGGSAKAENKPVNISGRPSLSFTVPSSALVGDTVTVTVSATFVTNCVPSVTTGAILIGVSGCNNFRLILGSPGTITVSISATGSNSAVISATPKQINVLPRPVFNTLDTVTVSAWSPEETDTPPEGMKAWYIWSVNGVKDSIQSTFIENASTAIIPIGRDSVIVKFGGDSRYSNDRKVTLYRGDYFHQIVPVILEPVSQKITSGDYSGQILPVSLKKCTEVAGPSDPSSFCRILSASKTTGGTSKFLLRWAKGSLPIKVGVVWAKSVGYSRSEDSTNIVENLINNANREMGETVFTYGSILGDTVPDGMIGITLGNNSWDNPGLASSGINVTPVVFPYTTAAALPEIYKSEVSIPSRIYLEPGFLISSVHELIHSLGFNHTCSWLTLMVSNAELGSGGACVGKRAFVLTPMDVAMYKFATSISDAGKKHNTVFVFN